MERYYKILDTEETRILEEIDSINIIDGTFQGMEIILLDNINVIKIFVNDDTTAILSKDSTKEINVNLSLKQIEKLYHELTKLIIVRGDTELLNELNFSEFKEYIKDCIKVYLLEDNKESFYNYIENNLYSIVCYGV